jgi:hypothetical protein
VAEPSSEAYQGANAGEGINRQPINEVDGIREEIARLIAEREILKDGI